MKKYVLLIISVIVAATWLCACSSDNDDDDNDFDVFNPNAIQPISLTEGDIVDFFNSELFEMHSGYDPYKWRNAFFPLDDFMDEHGNFTLDKCVHVINSRQELVDVYLGEKELPAIDFDKYTLIIGGRIMPCLGFYVFKKELVLGEDGLQLTIYARNDCEVLSLSLQYLYFWGLYPKQSQTTIIVNDLKRYTKFPPERSDY